MQKLIIRDSENEFEVYSDYTQFPCLTCGRMLCQGWTSSNYLFYFFPQEKTVHPVHLHSNMIDPFHKHQKKLHKESHQSNSDTEIQKHHDSDAVKSKRGRKKKGDRDGSKEFENSPE